MVLIVCLLLHSKCLELSVLYKYLLSEWMNTWPVSWLWLLFLSPTWNSAQWPGWRIISKLISASISLASRQSHWSSRVKGHSDCTASLTSVLALSLQDLPCTVFLVTQTSRHCWSLLCAWKLPFINVLKENIQRKGTYTYKESQPKFDFEVGPLRTGKGRARGKGNRGTEIFRT